MKFFIISSFGLLGQMAWAGVDQMDAGLKALAEQYNAKRNATGLRAGLISPDHATLGKIWNYGCWCYFNDNHGNGRSEPYNQVDGFCKVLHDGYDCVMMDAADDGVTGCVPWDQPYSPVIQLGINNEDLEIECAQKNDNDCSRRSCSVEGRFILNIFGAFFSGVPFDPTPKHSLGTFNPADDCPIIPGPPSPKECCGDYPVRYPFKTLDGDRACCGQRTFDDTIFDCCGDNSIQMGCL